MYADGQSGRGFWRSDGRTAVRDLDDDVHGIPGDVRAAKIWFRVQGESGTV